MKQKLKLFCAALAIAVALPFSIPAFASANQTSQGAASLSDVDARTFFSVGEGGTLRGFWLESFNNTDYPSGPKYSAKSAEAEAEKVVETAVKYGFNSIFYSVTPEMAAMYQSKYLPSSRFLSGTQSGISFYDPLKLLIDAAEKQKIDVCAVVSPFYLGDDESLLDKSNLASQNKSWTVTLDNKLYYNPSNARVQELINNIMGELASRYALSGVVIDFSEEIPFDKDDAYYTNLQQILKTCYQDVKKRNYEVQLGVILDGTTIEQLSGTQFVTQLVENNLVDFLLPQMLFSVAGQNQYHDFLVKWTGIVNGTSVQLFTVNDATRLQSPTTDGIIFGDRLEINYQQFVNALCNVNGSLVQNWSSLQLSAYPLAQDLMSERSITSDLIQDLHFSLPQGFAVLNPSNGLETDEDVCYVSGICDPTKELTVNGTTVTDISQNGIFGILLPLKEGINQFDFFQNGVTRNLSVIKGDAYHKTQSAPITTIQEDSAYPSYNEAIIVQDKITLNCIAPAGGKVSVKFQGVAYDLIQVDKELEDGQPAEFSLDLDFSSYDPALITKVNPLTYTLIYQGRTTVQNSRGNLTLIGNLQTPVVELIDPIVPVFEDPSGTTLSRSLQMNTVDYVTEIQDQFFKLRSGGYIRKSAANVLTEPSEMNTVMKDVKNVVVQTIPRGEYITLAGGAGAPYNLEYSEEQRSLTVSLYNINTVPQNLKHLKSELFNGIELAAGENGQAVITLKLKEDKNLYGYYISFNEGNAIIYCKSSFVTEVENTDANIGSSPQTSPLPLDGVIIVLDPGLGGKNNRQVGVLGITGPGGAELNLALASVLRNRLTAYGATVYLTRRDNTPISSIDRLMSVEYQNADIFLSIQHSQSPINQTGIFQSGVTVTYNQPFSRPLSQELSAALSYRLVRKENEIQEGNSYISQITAVPAVQINFGYVSNPYEYSRLCDPLEIYQSASIVTEEILNFVAKSEIA